MAVIVMYMARWINSGHYVAMLQDVTNYMGWIYLPMDYLTMLSVNYSMKLCTTVEIKIIQNCNKTNSDLFLRNMGIERNHNSETVSL